MKKRRKKKYRLKKSAYVLFLFVMLFVIGIIGLCTLKPRKNDTHPSISPIDQNEEQIPETFLAEIENQSFGPSEEIQNMIIDYLDRYMKSLYTLEMVDMKELFVTTNHEALLNEGAIETLLYSRKKNQNDMSLKSASYTIRYIRTEIKEPFVEVEIEEDDTFAFSFLNDVVSKARRIPVTFTFLKEGDSYKIERVRKTQDFYVMYTREIEDDSLDKIQSLKETYFRAIDAEQANLQKVEEYQVTKTCQHSYNREKAVEYARTYALTKNPEWFDYDTVGGNCQNFASQVILNGGIPMDFYGTIDNQWKHYSSIPNATNGEVGRSYSWTTVGYFYQYAKNNTGYGLCATVDLPLYKGEPGDIVQVGYNQNWNHTTVVVDTVKKDEKVVELLINSNSLDLENYPLHGYVYPEKRLIKILGWNEN